VEILFSSILCTCPNQRNLCNLIVCVMVGFLTIAWISLLVNILQFSFSLSYIGPRILLYTFISNMFNCFLSLLDFYYGLFNYALSSSYYVALIGRMVSV
jgi:uncharacterized membrane-anchored protein YitT (DUF2179 family)